MRNDHEDVAHLNGSTHDSSAYNGDYADYDPYRGSEYGTNGTNGTNGVNGVNGTTKGV